MRKGGTELRAYQQKERFPEVPDVVLRKTEEEEKKNRNEKMVVVCLVF